MSEVAGRERSERAKCDAEPAGGRVRTVAMAAAEGRSVGVERWTVYLLLSAQIMNNLAIRFDSYM